MAKGEEKGAEKPPFDPNKLLVQIEALLMKKSVAITDSGSPGRLSKSWIWAIILPLVALAGVAAFSWFVFRRNRELAKLRHEKFKRATLTEKAELDSYVAKGEAQVAKAQAKIEVEEEKLRVIEATIRTEEKRYEADRAAILRIRGWNGSYVRHGR